MTLAYTTLDGLLAVFLYSISYIVKAVLLNPRLKHETTSSIGILGNLQ